MRGTPAGMDDGTLLSLLASTAPIHLLKDRIHIIIVMIRWTGLAPWEFEFRSLTSTFPGMDDDTLLSLLASTHKKQPPLGPP